ncbi:MAG: hypothetical protein KME59_01950 [Trichormus sp. ATA11-4-KO1]|nr:hypothetical protein [Trichormus sp. ATA11-4-KO1]
MVTDIFVSPYLDDEDVAFITENIMTTEETLVWAIAVVLVGANTHP